MHLIWRQQGITVSIIPVMCPLIGCEVMVPSNGGSDFTACRNFEF